MDRRTFVKVAAFAPAAIGGLLACGSPLDKKYPVTYGTCSRFGYAGETPAAVQQAYPVHYGPDISTFLAIQKNMHESKER